MIVAMKRLLSTAAFLAGLASVPAMAACPERVSVGYGVTLSSVARACGVSAASLRLANPGLGDGTLRAGAIINVPRQRYSTPRTGSGRSSLRLAPSRVPPALGADGSSTVILPPVQPPIPQQHILRGFGDQPGQLPLPPGHSAP